MTSLGGKPETDTIIPSTELVGCIQDYSWADQMEQLVLVSFSLA